MKQSDAKSNNGRRPREYNAFPDLSPIRKAPSLTTINFCGFKLYGNSDFDPETNSYMTTQYFVALFIPLFPVARYRVISEGGNGYRFLGKGKLRPSEWTHMAAFLVIALYMFNNAGLR